MNKVCLNMIIKDQAPQIRRCIESVKPWIDTYEIVDCTHSEESESVVKEVLNGIAGGYHRCNWVSDLYVQNIALQFAREKAEYLLFIEPDDEILNASNFSVSQLCESYCYVAGTTTDRCYQSIYIQNLFYHNYPRMKWVKENGTIDMLWIQYPYALKSLALKNITTRFIQNKVRSHEL